MDHSSVSQSYRGQTVVLDCLVSFRPGVHRCENRQSQVLYPPNFSLCRQKVFAVCRLLLVSSKSVKWQNGYSSNKGHFQGKLPEVQRSWQYPLLVEFERPLLQTIPSVMEFWCIAWLILAAEPVVTAPSGNSANTGLIPMAPICSLLRCL